jgi:hypothetical protein
MVKKLVYRPNEFDDWGMIRDENGSLFAVVRRPATEEELSEHRRDGTDPYKDLADRLIWTYADPASQFALHASIVEENERLRKALETRSGLLGAFERDYPELYWHIAKGKVSAGEPLYGAIITLQGGTEIGHGESNLSAEDAFRIAFLNSGIPTPPSYSLPSRAEVRHALETIYRANGADLDQWACGALPSDDIKEAIAALSSKKEG